MGAEGYVGFGEDDVTLGAISNGPEGLVGESLKLDFFKSKFGEVSIFCC